MREINIVRNMVYGEPLKDFDLEEETQNDDTTPIKNEISPKRRPTILPPQPL